MGSLAFVSFLVLSTSTSLSLLFLLSPLLELLWIMRGATDYMALRRQLGLV